MLKKLLLISICLGVATLWAKNPISITFQYDDNIINKIIVSGAVNKTQWLGVSLYPKEYKDAIKNGYHQTRDIAPDSFYNEFTLDTKEAKKFNASYEIALWGKKVLQKDCLIPDCYWCGKNGFHLDELLFYQTGYFNATLAKK